MSWELDGLDRATLRTGDFSGYVELAHPDRGLQQVTLRNHSVSTSTWLGMWMCEGALDRLPGREQVEDAYVRGDDLIVRYAIPAGRTAVQRLLWNHRSRASISVVELRAYVQTELLASDPRSVFFSSLAPTTEVVRWSNAGWIPVEPGGCPTDASRSATEGAPFHMHLFRPLGSEVSLALVARVAPGQEDRVEFARDGVAWKCEMFPESLEKGVIRVAQVWGLCLPRRSDERHLVGWLDEISTRPLPLTT